MIRISQIIIALNSIQLNSAIHLNANSPTRKKLTIDVILFFPCKMVKKKHDNTRDDSCLLVVKRSVGRTYAVFD